MNKRTDVDVLRGMLDGQPVTHEMCKVYNVWIEEKYIPVVGKKGRVVTKIEKIRHSDLIGYAPKYIQNGEKLRDGLFPDLIRRHLVTPVTDGITQTFTVTETGRLVALYEQATFELELPTIAEYT